MNKIIKLFLTISLASSLVLVSAQITGGNAGCYTDPNTGKVVCNVGIQGTVGGGNGQQPRPGYTQCPNGTQVPQGYPCTTGTQGNVPVQNQAYTQGQYNRQSNMADLSFFGNLINGVGGIVRLLPPILLGIAVVVFFFFLIRYIIGGKNDPAKKKDALKGLLYSLLAIFVMVAL